MNQHWQEAPLKNLCIVDWGNTNLTKSSYIEGGQFLAVSAAGCDGRIGHKEHEAGTPVLSAIGAQCGKMFFPNEPFTAIKNTITLTPRQGICSGKFLFHLLNHITLPQRGAGQPFISKGDIQSFVVTYPEIREQTRIVTLLDEAFADIATAKANAEKNLQNARELFGSQRQLLLQPKDGWNEATLADLCNIKHGYAFEGEYFSDAGDHVLLTPGSFFETGGFRDRGEKTKYFTGPIPSDYVLNQGDLLVAMTEQATGLLGSPLLVPESNRFLHNQRLGLVTGKPDIPWTNTFFFHVFNLEAVRKAIHASASGAKVRHTSPGKIGAVKVAFPDNQAEQLLIAAQVEEIEQASIALQSIYRQKLTALDDLKKSLLHQAFSGLL